MSMANTQAHFAPSLVGLIHAKVLWRRHLDEVVSGELDDEDEVLLGVVVDGLEVVQNLLTHPVVFVVWQKEN